MNSWQQLRICDPWIYVSKLLSFFVFQRMGQLTEVKSVSSGSECLSSLRPQDLSVLGFPICKMRIIEVPALQGFVRIEWGNVYKALRTGLVTSTPAVTVLVVVIYSNTFFLVVLKNLTCPSQDFSTSFQREHKCLTPWPCHLASQVYLTSEAVLIPLDQQFSTLTASQIPMILNLNLPEWDLGICSLKNCSVNANGHDHWIRVWGTTVDYAHYFMLTNFNSKTGTVNIYFILLS